MNFKADVMHNRIKVLRKKRGLTMQQLADAVGTSQQQVDRLEKSKRRLTVEWMEKLSRALDCEFVDLVPLDNARNAQTTSKAKIVGSVDSAADNALQTYTDKDTYIIIFGRVKEITNPKLFGLLVQGNKLAGYPEGTELIFNEVPSSTKVNAGKLVVVLKQSGEYSLRTTPIDPEDETLKAILVKSIKDE